MPLPLHCSTAPACSSGRLLAAAACAALTGAGGPTLSVFLPPRGVPPSAPARCCPAARPAPGARRPAAQQTGPRATVAAALCLTAAAPCSDGFTRVGLAAVAVPPRVPPPYCPARAQGACYCGPAAERSVPMPAPSRAPKEWQPAAPLWASASHGRVLERRRASRRHPGNRVHTPLGATAAQRGGPAPASLIMTWAAQSRPQYWPCSAVVLCTQCFQGAPARPLPHVCICAPRPGRPWRRPLIRLHTRAAGARAPPHAGPLFMRLRLRRR
jgi:hypothetical protein